MAVHLLKFVDSIAASPTERLNINDGTIFSAVDVDASPPRLRRAMSQNAMTDGGFVSSSQYEMRVVKATLLLSRSTQDLNATQLQLLARELDRADNYLMFQPNGLTKPVFFRTVRSDFTSIREVPSPDAAVRAMEFECLAEPFALGLREDAVAAAVVAHDPAAATNPVSFTVTPRGDVATDPIIWFTSGTPTGAYILASQGNDDAVVLVQAESASSLSTDTALNANDVLFSGSGSNSFRTTFATDATLVTRATYAALTRPGTYRVYMRCRSTVGAPAAFTAQLSSLGMSTMDVTAFPGTSTFQMIDLGIVTTPKGDGLLGLNANPLPTANTFTLALARTAGSGSLDVDYLLFIPADEHSSLITLADSTRHVFDGLRDQVAIIPTAQTPFTATALDPIAGGSGSLPRLVGGRANRIFVMQTMSNIAISSTLTVSLSYFPAYLYVRPSAT